MTYDPLPTRRERRNMILDQAQNYLKMVREKAEEGDKEGEKYWRERTIERLQEARIGPIGCDDWGLYLLSID